MGEETRARAARSVVADLSERNISPSWSGAAESRRLYEHSLVSRYPTSADMNSMGKTSRNER